MCRPVMGESGCPTPSDTVPNPYPHLLKSTLNNPCHRNQQVLEKTRIPATSSKQRKPMMMVGERRAWPSCLFSRLLQLLSCLQQLQNWPDKIEMVAMSFLIFSCWTEKDNIWDRSSGSVLHRTFLLQCFKDLLYGGGINLGRKTSS